MPRCREQVMQRRAVQQVRERVRMWELGSRFLRISPVRSANGEVAGDDNTASTADEVLEGRLHSFADV